MIIYFIYLALSWLATVFSALYVITFPTVQIGRYFCYAHFSGGQTEAQNLNCTSPRSLQSGFRACALSHVIAE